MAGIDNLKEQHDKMKNGLAAEIGARGGLAKKGSKHINTWVQELMNDEEFTAWVPDTKAGWKEFKGAPIKAIIQAQMAKALQGDTKAYDSLVKSGWVAKQEIDLTSNGETVGATDVKAAAEFAEFLKTKGK